MSMIFITSVPVQVVQKTSHTFAVVHSNQESCYTTQPAKVIKHYFTLFHVDFKHGKFIKH